MELLYIICYFNEGSSTFVMKEYKMYQKGDFYYVAKFIKTESNISMASSPPLFKRQAEVTYLFTGLLKSIKT